MKPNGQPGVVITGIGAVSPFGFGRERFWQHVSAGCSGVKKITQFDVAEDGGEQRERLDPVEVDEALPPDHHRIRDHVMPTGVGLDMVARGHHVRCNASGKQQRDRAHARSVDRRLEDARAKIRYQIAQASPRDEKAVAPRSEYVEQNRSASPIASRPSIRRSGPTAAASRGRACASR